MSEEGSISNNQQDMLKDLMVGGNLTTRDVTQQNIENQINLLLLNIPDDVAINKAFSNLIPDDWYNWRDKPKDIKDILAQLEEIPSQNPNNSPLLKFIYLLTQNKNLPPTTRDKLKEILANQSFEINGKTTSTQPLHSYLLIQLRPEANNELFVKAWFIPDDTIQDPWERFKPLTVDEQQPEIPLIPEELPQLLGNLLQQCFDEYLQGEPTELTIEIFLPRDRLSDEVEKWTYQDSEGFDITIGMEHRVVVRSYDRLKTLRKQQGSYWKKNWESVQLNWENILCCEHITTVSQACFNLNDLRNSLRKTKIVLKVCCNLSNSDRDGLLKAIHSVGTPIVLWSRCEVKTLKNPHHFDALLETPLQELSARVKAQRFDADDEMHLGNHLVLLWDDPNRVPPNYLLQSPGL